MFTGSLRVCQIGRTSDWKPADLEPRGIPGQAPLTPTRVCYYDLHALSSALRMDSPWTVLTEQVGTVMLFLFEVPLDVNAEKTRYQFRVSRHQNAGQSHNLTISNKSFENVASQIFRNYSANQNCIHDEIKRRLNPKNFSWYSVQYLRLLISSPKTLRL
jgi:hypothetical protein